MSQTELSIHLDNEVTECGDAVSGEVRWGPVDPVPRRVLVALRFATSGSGTPPDSGEVAEVELRGAESGRERFELEVPANGPITFVGRSISVSWQVEARLDQRAKRDPTTSRDVTVLPSGGLAVWARQSAPPPSDPSDIR